jgi:lipopolysaccharide export LptBFGC system permease protein LptF
MNNIGIILNQDNNNQSYLGKFYNRNTLEFPVIRKIYEQIELNKTNNNPTLVDKNNSFNHEPKNDYINSNIGFDETLKSITDKIIIENEYTDTNNDEIDSVNINHEIQNNSNEIIILDKGDYISVKNSHETNLDAPATDLSHSEFSTSELSNKIINSKDLYHIENHNYNECVVNNNGKNVSHHLTNFTFKYNFNTSELVFLWLSSILLMVSIEMNVFKNSFSL